MTSPTRQDWFEFLSDLHLVDGAEETSLVGARSPLRSRSQDSIVGLSVEFPIDWWIHIGGPLRKELESDLLLRLASASELCFSVRMKPDPVLTFEIEAWIVGVLRPILLERESKSPLRLSFQSGLKEKKAWSRAISIFSEIPWKPLPETAADRAEYWLDPMGLDQVSAGPGIFENFIDEMVAATVDPCEPPWIFWSRFPAWWTHWDRRQPSRPKALTDAPGEKEKVMFLIDSRLTFLRCALSPQDESAEEQSLDSNEVMLNPTFETVLRPSFGNKESSPVLAFCRRRDVVVSLALTSLEAFIVDAVRESFRLQNENLIGLIQSESRIEVEFIRKAISRLVDSGLLLRR